MESHDRRDKDAWFIVSRQPGRISAVPCKLAGWLVLLAWIGLLTAGAMIIMPLARDALGVGGAIAVHLLWLTLGFVFLFRIIIAQGRPPSSDNQL